MTSQPRKTNLVGAAFVPGLPQVLLSQEANSGYKSLADSLKTVGAEFARRGVKRVVYYSTQWISVLGHSFQAKADLKGMHVDENWYGLGDLPFSFRIDTAFAEAMATRASAAGYQTKLVDYNGFPVDTGTIVVDTLLNEGRFATNMLSCCVYSDYADTVRLAGTVRDAIDGGEKATAVVVVSGLSGRYFTTEIDPREDHIRDPKDDEWNKRILAKLVNGDIAGVEADLPTYAATCKVDMGLKGLAVLKGVGAYGVSAASGKAVQLAYAPIYGTGAATLLF